MCTFIYVYTRIYLYVHVYISSMITSSGGPREGPAPDRPTPTAAKTRQVILGGREIYIYMCTFIYVYTRIYLYVHVYISSMIMSSGGSRACPVPDRPTPTAAKTRQVILGGREIYIYMCTFIYVYTRIYLYVHVYISSMIMSSGGSRACPVPDRPTPTAAKTRLVILGGRKNIHIYVYIYICVCVCIYVYICICIYIYLYVYIRYDNVFWWASGRSGTSPTNADRRKDSSGNSGWEIILLSLFYF